MFCRKLFFPLFLSFALVAILSLPAFAQNRTIRGKVTDENGKPVQDAQITIQATDQARILTAKTNKRGEYTYLLGIQQATYRVIVRKAGFSPQYKDNVRPELNEPAVVDFQLTPGPDQKLPFEMTDEDREKLRQQAAEAQKRKQFSAELKAHFDQGVQLASEEKFAEAAEAFEKALKIDPKQPGILSRLAEAQSKQGKNEEALASYQSAIALAPTDADLFTNMGVILSKLGKTEESQEAFKKAAELNPTGGAQSHYNLGVSMFNSGNTEQAIAAFKQAIAADPNFAEAYFQLGICLSAKADTIPAAVEAMKKYIEIGKKPEQVEVAKQLVSSMEKK